MEGIFGCAIIILLLHLKLPVSGADDVTEAFYKFGVVPGVINVAPSALVEVVYPGDIEVLLGNELQATQMLTAPSVAWEADTNSFYTLAMVDPDVPSRDIPSLGQFLHWLVGNIPGSDVSRGQTLATYAPPTPPPASGLHRYVYLVYQQSDRNEYNATLLNFTTEQLRVKFSINDFAAKNSLESPLYGNFCQVQVVPLQLL